MSAEQVEIAQLRKALAVERERAEKAEADRDLAKGEAAKWHGIAMKAGVIVCAGGQYIYAHKERAEKAEASLAEAKRLLKPFAGVLPKTSAHVAIDRFLAPKGGPDHHG